MDDRINRAPTDVDYDHLDRTLTHEQVWSAYADMREKCPVVHNDRHGGHLHVTRYEEVRDASNRASEFSSADGGFIPPSGLPRMAPIDYDGEDHHFWRSLMQEPVSPPAVRALSADIEAIVDRHLDEFASIGSANLAGQLAEPVPAHVVGRVVGLDVPDCGTLREEAIRTFHAIGTSEFEQAKASFDAFIHDQIAQRRANPRGDFLTDLALGRLGERTLSDDEITGVLTALLIGGHHSTAAAMGALIHQVLTIPGLREVVDGGGPKLTALIEESLRLTTPLHIFARTATTVTKLADVEVPAGARLFINYASANHDPRRFPKPEEFALDRKPNPHVAFGFGPHLCLGRHLARHELKTAITRLFERLPDLHLDGEVTYSTLQGGKLLEIVDLPVAFTPTD